MSDTPANPRKFHLFEGGAVGFSDKGERVLVAWPQDEPEPREADLADEALDVMKRGLIIALETGRADGIAARCAALGILAGLFTSPTGAAERLGLDRTAIARGVETIREGLQLDAHRKNYKPIENKVQFSPEPK